MDGNEGPWRAHYFGPVLKLLDGVAMKHSKDIYGARKINCTLVIWWTSKAWTGPNFDSNIAELLTFPAAQNH